MTAIIYAQPSWEAAAYEDGAITWHSIIAWKIDEENPTRLPILTFRNAQDEAWKINIVKDPSGRIRSKDFEFKDEAVLLAYLKKRQT